MRSGDGCATTAKLLKVVARVGLTTGKATSLGVGIIIEGDVGGITTGVALGLGGAGIATILGVGIDIDGSLGAIANVI